MEKELNDQSPPIVVIGAGVVGVMTAYSLAKRGHRVTVIDQLRGPAELCSHANAGVLAVGHATAWARPEAIGSIFRALLGREPSVRITRLWDPALWRWGIDFLRHCTPSAHRANTAKLMRLSRYSCDQLASFETDMGLPKETRQEGGLYLFQKTAQFQAHVSSLEDQDHGAQQVLDCDGLIAHEPGLASMAEMFVGGVLSPADAVGDCRLFTVRTHDYLAQTGRVTFMFNTTVTGFQRREARIDAVKTDHGEVPCAQVVLATGVETPDLTRPLGFNPLIYPVKGYSSTWRILDPAGVPRLPFIDETELVSVATYGERLRVTSIAEFAGRDRTLPDDRIAHLSNYVRRAFGSAIDTQTPEFWTGLRPSTPAGPPYLGRVRSAENLWINAGHGQLGWTMSLGSGEILAQLISGTAPALTGVSAQARWLEPA